MRIGDLKQTGNWRARAELATWANHLIDNAHCLVSNGIEKENYYEAEDCLRDAEECVSKLRAILSRPETPSNPQLVAKQGEER